MELWNALQTKDDTSITLYAVWRPIIYTISTNSLAGGYVDNNNEIGYNTLEDLIYNLNDIHNSVGTSPAKISNNNHFKVVYDTVITDLPEVSRVGYDFTGFVAKIDSLENNMTGKTANIKSSDISGSGSSPGWVTIMIIGKK